MLGEVSSTASNPPADSSAASARRRRPDHRSVGGHRLDAITLGQQRIRQHRAAMSERGSSTVSPGLAVGQTSARAAAEPPVGGTRSTGRPASRSAAAVAGPTAATRVSAGTAGSRPSAAARSSTASTALTEVKADPGEPAAGQVDHARDRAPGSTGGAIAISSHRTPSAPTGSRASISSPARSAGRGTSTRQPASGPVTHRHGFDRRWLASRDPLTVRPPAAPSAPRDSSSSAEFLAERGRIVDRPGHLAGDLLAAVDRDHRAGQRQ